MKPEEQATFEEDLRRRLALAASSAPAYRPAPARRRRRWVRPALAAGVVACGAAVALPLFTGGQPTTDAACAFTLEFDGHDWSGAGDLHRMPRTGERLGEGVVPGCDDGNGRSPDRTVPVHRVAGQAAAETMVIAEEMLWLPDDMSEVPTRVTEARAPVPCEAVPGRRFVGQLIGILPTREPRFDGDLRAPFQMELRTEDRALLGDRWAWATLSIRGTQQTRVPGPEEIQSLLFQEEPTEVRVHCEGGVFVADSFGADPGLASSGR